MQKFFLVEVKLSVLRACCTTAFRDWVSLKDCSLSNAAVLFVVPLLLALSKVSGIKKARTVPMPMHKKPRTLGIYRS